MTDENNSSIVIIIGDGSPVNEDTIEIEFAQLLNNQSENDT